MQRSGLPLWATSPRCGVKRLLRGNLAFPRGPVQPTLTIEKSSPGCPTRCPSPAKIFPPWSLCFGLPMPPRAPACCWARREFAMTATVLPPGLRHESLEVGAAPLLRHFLDRLDLVGLFQQHLPKLPGRAPTLPSAC